MSRGARPEGLPRRHRFSISGSFGAILRGSRKVRGNEAILHVAAGKPGASRFGIALARRVIPRAVDRNHVKRMAREAFRRHPAKRAGLDIVLALRAAPTNAAAWGAEVRRLLDAALERPAR